MFSTDDTEVSYFSYNGRIYYKEKLNDTLFFLDNKYDLIPSFTFRLGKYLMPVEYRERVFHGQNPGINFIFIKDVFEISGHLLFDCDLQKYMPAKRLTPMYIHGIEIWHNTRSVLGLYDKKKKSQILIRPTSTDNPLYTSGFYNDIDCGPRFFPKKQVNDSTLAMWFDAKQLKEHVGSDDFKNSKPLYPEKKKELEALANRLSDFDDPVLMLVTFKKRQ